jgi:hypothetical protein
LHTKSAGVDIKGKGAKEMTPEERVKAQFAQHEKQFKQREWVGLTYEEIVVLNHQSYDAQLGLLPLTFYSAIEAKLKEKNT